MSSKQNSVHDELIFLDVPLLHILTKSCTSIISPLWKVVCSARWILSRPLRVKVLPKWFPSSIMSVPYLKHVPFICYGEVLFLIPIVVILLRSVDSVLRNKDVKESGSICTLPLLVVFLTANKSNSIITFALGIPYERMIFWHALWSLAAVTTAALHLYCAFYLGEKDNRRRLDDYSKYELNGGNPNLIKFCLDGDTNITGTITLLSITGLVFFSSISTFRRWFFELWYILHVVGAIVAAYFAHIHGADKIIFVLGWYGIDFATRYVLMAGILYPKKATLKKLSDDFVEISFPKPKHFEYEAGQYAMIAIPKISYTQFHPFTISSSPSQNNVTMHIKCLGRWTQKLVKVAGSEGNEITFLMEGPYGKLMIELENRRRYKMVLMISGGIGITPMYSIANELLHEHKNKGRELKKIKFVWAIKSFEMMDAMMDGSGRRLVPQESTIFDYCQDDILDLKIYVTRNTSSNRIRSAEEVKVGKRPNLLKVFEKMKAAALSEGETHVAVLACGPKRLVDSCRMLSRKCSDEICQRIGREKGVVFDFHEETFEL